MEAEKPVLEDENSAASLNSLRTGDYEDSMGMMSRSDLDLDSQPDLAYGMTVTTPNKRNSRRSLPNRGEPPGDKENSHNRARPRKPHEPSPFLSVNTLPLDKKENVSANGLRNDSRQAIPTPHNTGSRMGSGIGSRAGSRPQSRGGSLVSSEWNSLVPRQHKNMGMLSMNGTAPDNIHVKSPFKHLAKKPHRNRQRPVSPSMALRQHTAMATSSVARTLAKHKSNSEPRKNGKLLKAKLRPMNPVKVEGPSIQQCRGIIAEKESQFNSNSRSLQRRQQVIQNHMANNDYLLERPQTQESIHQTSIASDFSDNRLAELKPELDALENTDDPKARASAEDGGDGETGDIQQTSHIVETAEHLRNGMRSNTFLTEQQEDDDDRDPPQNPVLDSDNLRPTSSVRRSESANTRNHLQSSSMPDVEKSGIAGKASEGILKGDSLDEVKVAKLTRPRTTTERKAVRFAEDAGALQADRRAKSAIARLAQQDQVDSSEEQPKKLRASSGKCRPNINNNSNKHGSNDDEDDLSSPPDIPGNKVNASGTRPKCSRQPFCCSARHASGKQRARSAVGSMNSRRVTFHDQEPQGRVGCLEDSVKGEDKPLFGGASQPESLVPPVIPYSGYRRPTSGKRKSNKPKIVGSRSRPQSAKNPNKFTVERVRDFHRRQRPASAQFPRRSFDEPEFEIDFVIRPEASVDLGSSYARATGHSSCATRSRRPVSGLSILRNSVSVDVDEGSDTDSDDVGLAIMGYKKEQSLKGGICTQCNKPTNKIAVYSDSMGVLLCEVCNRINHAKIRKYREMAALNKNFLAEDIDGTESGDDGDLVPDEVITDDVELDEMLETLERERDAKRELQRASQPSLMGPEKLRQNEGRKEKRQDNFFGKVSDMEKTLQGIQESIEKSLDNVQCRGSSCEDAIPFSVHTIDDNSKMYEHETLSDHVAEGSIGQEIKDEGNSCIRKQKLELSEYLTHIPRKAETYEMNVYHYWKGAKQLYKTDQTSYTPDSREQKKGSDLDNDPDITTYQVTMMKEGVQEYGILNQDVNKLEDQIKKEMSINLGIEMDQGSTRNTEPPDNTPLEVVATAKTRNKKNDSLVEPIASVPPLCFKVNARPPEGYLYYFAYGTDMNPNRMSTYVQRTMVDRLWGLLFGFKMLFNKRGIDEEAGGFPNVEYDAESSVEGCLYTITLQEMQLLDRCVGYPEHYEHVMLPVWMLNCKDPDSCGVAQYCVPALVYIAKDKWTTRGEKLDIDNALEQCIRSADMLSPAYKDHLQNLRPE